jgi:hypothetical protein
MLFKIGELVMVSYDDDGLLPSTSKWMEANKKAIGIIRDIFVISPFPYFVEIKKGGLMLYFREEALKGFKDNSTSISKSTPKASSEKERLRNFLFEEKEEIVRWCPKCGAKMKPLAISFYCPRCNKY